MKQKCSSKALGRKEGHHSTKLPTDVQLLHHPRLCEECQPSNPLSLKQQGNVRVHPVPVTEVQLFVWAGRLPAPCPAGTSAISGPGWCWSCGQGRSHIKHRALCCTPSCQPTLGLGSLLTVTHLPPAPTKPATGLSFTFPRVERTWPIFIAANQASSALDALRKIAEVFLSPGLFIIHQIGFQLPPSILCVVFPKIWILVYDEVLLRIKKEDTERQNRRKENQMIKKGIL